MSICRIATVALTSLSLASAAGAQAQPPKPDCHLSAHEKTMAAETLRLLVKTVNPNDISEGPGPYHHPPGCTVVAITVAPDGSVRAARVLRDESGYGGVLTMVAREQRYAPRRREWRGLLSLATAPGPTAR
jgi:hypothetical protein